jgi:hypothetical protein
MEEVVAMSNQPTSNLTRVLTDEGGAIVRELSERLDAELSEKDVVAVSSAITRALLAGAQRGIAEATAQVIEQLPGAEIKLHADVLQHDEWAERYGGDE